MALTDRRLEFVNHYLESLNAADAARKVGYSAKTARQQAYALLREPDIAAAIKQAREARAARFDITAERLLEELRCIAFLDPRAFFDWGPDDVTVKPSTVLTDGEARSVSEVSMTVTPAGRTIKVKPYDKLAALRLLKDLLGLGGPAEDGGEDIGDYDDPPVAEAR